MSKHYSSNATPEFATQPDYSDIFVAATPPKLPKSTVANGMGSNHSTQSRAVTDPWGDSISTDLAESPGAEQASIPAIDPWAETLNHEPEVSPKFKENPVASIPKQQIAVPARSAAVATVVRTPQLEQPTKQTPQPQSSPVANTPAKAAEIDRDAPSLTGKDLALKYCASGRKALAAKDYAQARSAFKIAVEWDPNLAIAHSGTAQICQDIQDYEGALVAWDLAIKCDPKQLDFYYQRASINKILKNYFQILVDCKQILAQAPDHPSARWLNAVALVKIESYADALTNLDRHIEVYPQDPSGYCYRGICNERLDRLPLALADLDRAISLQANQPVFHHARGRTRQKMGDLQGALVDFNLTIERKPQAAVYDDRAEVQRALGNCIEALQDCDQAIELNSKLMTAYFRRGLVHTELGELALALADYDATIDLNPEYANAYIQRSWIHFRLNDYPRAKQDCRTVQSFNQPSFWANYVSGIVDSLSGRWHNALKNFSKAIEISPNYVSAYYHRGVVYHELGDQPKATADFEQARSLQDRGLERLVDRDETGFYAEGLSLYHLGQPEAARTVMILGALAAKRFNNPSFHKLMLAKIEDLGMASGELSSSASNSCDLNQPAN
jgi:tetratricopeptide (TPR) repeat protein